MKTCEQIEILLDDFVDGTIGVEARGEVEQHLGTCPDCRSAEAELRALLDSVAALPHAIAPPQALWGSIAARIGEGKSEAATKVQREAWARRIPFFYGGLAAAAALLVALAGAIVFKPAPIEHGADRTQTLWAEYEQAEEAYLRAYASLRVALDEREAQLSSETRAVIDENLAVIDAALADIREAYAMDPGNTKLMRMLLATNQWKADFLGRAVRLPQ